MARLHFIPLVGLAILSGARAYIPSLPTNSTDPGIQGGPNVTDVSKLHLQWFSNGSYWENVSYQLVGYSSNGISKGALVHFSEDDALNESTTTPWIALVACDANGTRYSLEDDIFTLARDRGAVSALLYSLYSKACIINPEYASPEHFDQVFDIFSTQSLTSAHLIEYQFGQFGAYNETIYRSYNASLLSESGQVVNASISTHTAIAPGYLIATLQAYNATVTTNDTSPNEGQGGASAREGRNNTSLAMIILYAITGCISALFIIVIISGAIRAIRHPERYGPRAGPDGEGMGGGQSRARGLTRAILDTFPIVKFGSNTEDTHDRATPIPDKNSERHSYETGPDAHGIEMIPWEVVNVPSSSSSGIPNIPPNAHHSSMQVTSAYLPEFSPLDLLPSPRPPRDNTPKQAQEVVPDSIGRETCPICIVDFEEGDDLRILPCEGKHRFHQACVDPWLLELSSSCPICRQDFHALEAIISGSSDDGQRRASYLPQNRFSRYLRFARRRQREDPTDPYIPPAPETTM